MFHTSLGSPSKPTILLLHGIFCSHLQFAHVTPFLSDYHVLLVDLPGHSRSSSAPFSLSSAVAELAELIKAHGSGARAHVVGLSFGGFLALELARLHPELVLSVFASGATPFRGVQHWLASHPWVLYVVVAGLVRWMPDSVYWWMSRRMGVLRHDDLRAEMKANLTVDMLSRGYGGLLAVDMEGIGSIEGVRAAVVAGGLQDDVESTREMGRLLAARTEGSGGFVVRKAIHGWDLQFPELFGQGIRALVEGREMPAEYERLA